MVEEPKRYIYVIASDRDGPVKVGVSNDPAKRLAQLQTGHDKLLQLFAAEECLASHALALETVIHRQLGYLRLVGEWFSLDVDSAIAEVQFAIIRFASDDSFERELRRKSLTRSARKRKKT